MVVIVIFSFLFSYLPFDFYEIPVSGKVKIAQSDDGDVTAVTNVGFTADV